MARTLTAAFKAELTAASKRPVFAVEFDFVDGFTRIHSGHGNLTLDGNSYTGVGDLMSLDFPQETTRPELATCAATVSGLDSSTLADVLPGEYKGRDMSIFLGFLNASRTVIADPVEWKFKMDMATIEESGESSVVVITGISKHSSMRRPANSRYTDRDQRARYPLDTGLQWVSQLLDSRTNSGTKLNTVPIEIGGTYSGGTEEDAADLID